MNKILCVSLFAFVIGCGGKEFTMENESYLTGLDSGIDTGINIDSDLDTVINDDVDIDVKNEAMLPDVNVPDTNQDTTGDINVPDTIPDSLNDVAKDNEADACIGSQTDPINCGTCGHSCEGGNCSSGKCEPVIIATGISAEDTGDIVTDNEYVYWSQLYGIMKQSKHGGPNTKLSPQYGNAGSLIIVDNYLYFSVTQPSVNSIYRCNKAGDEFSAIISNVNSINSLGADSTNIYAVRYTGVPGNSNSVFKAPLAGGSAETISISQSPRHLVVDDNFVYWGDIAALSIMKISKTGGTATTLSTNNHSRKLALDSSYVYWANGSSPELGIFRILKSGGTKEKLTDSNNSWGVALYDQYVYWTDILTNSINRVPKEGGNNEVIAVGQHEPHNIVVDEHAIYWANRGNDTVMKLVK